MNGTDINVPLPKRRANHPARGRDCNRLPCDMDASYEVKAAVDASVALYGQSTSS